jgi:hypothetical protein
MVASSAPDVSHHVWKARRVSSTGLTYPAMRDLTILPIHKRMKAKSFHHRLADPKPVEPAFYV